MDERGQREKWIRIKEKREEFVIEWKEFVPVDQMIDSVSEVFSDDVGDKINAKMSTQPQVDVSEVATRSDYNVNDAHSVANNGKGEVNSTDQTQSNNNTTNQTTACNIKMDAIETTIVADISECSLNGLEKDDITIESTASVSHGADHANSVKCSPPSPLPTMTMTATATNPSPIVLAPCQNTTVSLTTTTAIDSSSDNDLDEIQKLFETKSLLIEKWLRERAPQDVLMKMHAATDCVRTPKSPKLRTSSVTSDLFQQWLATSPVQVCRHKREKLK